MINCENDGWRVKFRSRDRCLYFERKFEYEESFCEDCVKYFEWWVEIVKFWYLFWFFRGNWIKLCFMKKRVIRNELRS